MVARADRSLLPGAPHSGADRAPKGSYAIDIAASRAFSLDSQILADVTDPDICPAAVLPFLAWAYSVDEWPAGATEDEKRAIIKASIAVHRRKGTPQSIRAVLTAAGYGDAEIYTGGEQPRYNGEIAFDGSVYYGSAQSWADWWIIIANSDPLPSDELISLLVQTAPARCRLISVGYQQLFFRYNGLFRYDGTRHFEKTYTEAA
jgi:hypothetical protein